MHVVMIGSDGSVFEPDAASDTKKRLLRYGQRFGDVQGHLTYVVIGSNGRSFEESGVRFVSVPGNRFTALIRLFGALRRLRPVAVATTQTAFEDAWVAMAALPGVPLVAQVHYDFTSPSSAPKWRHRARVRLGRRLLGRFAAIRVVSTELERVLRRLGARCRIEVIPVPVTMVPGESRPSRPHVLYVGRLDPEKNLSQWLDVAAIVRRHVPDVTFTVVGDGVELQSLRTKAARLELDVELVGPKPYEDLHAYYESASLLLLTSQYEGFGRVLVEAMLHGVPVVAPAVAGPRDIVDDGVTGFLHDVTATEAFAQSVEAILTSPPLRERLGQAAREAAMQRFDPEEIVRRWTTLLTEVASSHRP